MSSQETPEVAEGGDAADAVAQLLAWGRRLIELGRLEDARQVFLDALNSAADPVPITMALARLEYDAGATERAAEFLRKVLVDRPGNLEAAQGLAQVLLERGNLDEAARVISDARDGGDPQPDGSGPFAELAGEILLRQGRHAAAVAAFGSTDMLTSRGRRLRRRAWLRSGGPLRRHRAPGSAPRGGAPLPVAGTPDVPSSATPADPSDAILKATAWAAWLRSEERFDDARRVLGDAAMAYGRHPSLLACAAQVEESADAPQTALYLWDEAWHQAPDDIGIVCGLAWSVCRFDVRFPYVGRVRDALRVLDAVREKAHPQVREARVQVLSYDDASAARRAAAYGAAAGLPSWQVRDRRRLLLRSCGPFGQLILRLGDWVRNRRYRQLDTGPIPRISAESEDIARFLDTVSELPSDEACQRIEAAIREHGRQPSLLLASADFARQKEWRWQRVAAAAEAARLSLGNLDAMCELALAVYQTHGYGTALQVLKSLQAGARATVKARVTTATLHMWAGNPALAAAAYGDSRDLDKYFRSRRRRLAVRGLIQRLRSGVSGDDVAAIDALSVDMVPPAIARLLDEAESQPDSQARETLRMAMAGHDGRHPMLLLELARTERRDGDDEACAALAREAMQVAPDDPLITAEAINELWLADYDADALALLDSLDASFRDSVAVCATAGDICSYWQLWAHAATAFGRNGLEAWRWRTRRTSWWRSGGPVEPIRTRIRTAENRVLPGLKPPAEQETALTALTLPDPVVNVVRGQLATHRLDWNWRMLIRPNRRYGRLNRLIGTVLLLAAFGALVLVQRARWPSDSIVEDIAAAALCMIAMASVAWLLNRFSWRYDVARLGFAVVLDVGAWFLLASHGRIVVDAGLALIVLGTMPLVMYPISRALSFIRRLRIARWQRREAEMAALDSMLSLLGELLAPRRSRDAASRRNWMADLERLAVIIERDFPHALPSGDQHSQRIIADHARGAAHALRCMKATIALPDETAWHAMTDQLTGLARALAARDFTGWPAPLPEVHITRSPRSPRRRVMDATRTVLVIFAPPLVAFLLPLALPLSGPGVPWLRFATTVWALLGTIIALDPDWSTRIAKMHEWFDVVRSATPSGNKDSDSASADTYTPPAAEGPRRPPPRPPRVRTPSRSRR